MADVRFEELTGDFDLDEFTAGDRIVIFYNEDDKRVLSIWTYEEIQLSLAIMGMLRSFSENPDGTPSEIWEGLSFVQRTPQGIEFITVPELFMRDVPGRERALAYLQRWAQLYVERHEWFPMGEYENPAEFEFLIRQTTMAKLEPLWIAADRFDIPQLFTAFARSYDNYITETRVRKGKIGENLERVNAIAGFDLERLLASLG